MLLLGVFRDLGSSLYNIYNTGSYGYQEYVGAYTGIRYLLRGRRGKREIMLTRILEGFNFLDNIFIHCNILSVDMEHVGAYTAILVCKYVRNMKHDLDIQKL